MRIIETGAFTLEPQVAAHADEMFVVLSDPAIYQYENEPPPSREWLRTRFTKLETRLSANGHEQWLNWVIRLPTSELIGYVQATVRPDGRAAIAYELSSAYWGRGLGGHAVKAMISELVEHYQVRSLFAVLKRENLRSVRMLERLGFSLASPEQHIAHQVELGEVLMHHDCSAHEKGAEHPMPTSDPLEVRNGLCTYRPRGKYSLVEAVDLVSRAIGYCRDRGVNMLLIDVTGLIELPIPTLVDRFLMVEDWAQEAKGTVVVAMVAPPEYIHPRKFGVTVAAHFGLICDVYTSEEDASKWLSQSATHAALSSK